MKALKRKKSAELLKLGEERNRAKRQSPAELAEWKRNEPSFRHEARPDEVVVDLDRRVARVAQLSVAAEFKDRLPSTGVATWRQLSPIGEFWLRKLLEVGLIHPGTTRAQLDVLRGLQRGKALAPRHRPRAK